MNFSLFFKVGSWVSLLFFFQAFYICPAAIFLLYSLPFIFLFFLPPFRLFPKCFLLSHSLFIFHPSLSSCGIQKRRINRVWELPPDNYSMTHNLFQPLVEFTPWQNSYYYFPNYFYNLFLLLALAPEHVVSYWSFPQIFSRLSYLSLRFIATANVNHVRI